MAENESEDRRRAVLLLVLPSVLALIAVLALIGALLGLFGEPVDEELTAQPSAAPTASANADEDTAASASPSASVPSLLITPSPYVPAEEAWSGSSSDEGAGSGSGSSSGSGSGSGKEIGTGNRPLPVYVLNQTTRDGLAAAVAEDIESAGWSVTKVSWWRGVVPSTTVYYPPGYESAAEALSAAFSAIDRVRPRVAPMPDDALTVILCKEYPEV
jgi:hypothetical protein